MKIRWRLLILCIVLPLAAGGAAAFLARNGMEMFQSLRKPGWFPPAWLFPLVWTCLYTLMGISSYLILTAEASEEDTEKAVTRYGYQLLANFLWPTFFFCFQWYLFSFLWILLLLWLVTAMCRQFYGISKTAALLNVPYLLWLAAAGVFNFVIWRIN